MPRELTKTRCEAFSDGVIAVIITVMVLELKVPHAAGWRGLLEVVPTLAVYLISFFFVGTYWVNHHVLMERIERVGIGLLWLNLLWLLTLSLVPFFTEYIGEHHFDGTSVVLYALVNLAVGVTFTFISNAIHSKLKRNNALERADIAARHKQFRSLATYTLAIGLAILGHTYIALGLMAAVVLLWVRPEFGLHDERDRSRIGLKSDAERATL